MSGIGRFGKYGDLKRKQQIRATRVAGSAQGKGMFASAKAGQGKPATKSGKARHVPE